MSQSDESSAAGVGAPRRAKPSAPPAAGGEHKPASSAGAVALDVPDRPNDWCGVSGIFEEVRRVYARRGAWTFVFALQTCSVDTAHGPISVTVQGERGRVP